MLADDGRVVSARRYNAFSGALEGEVASGNGRPDRYEKEWYTPETPAAGQAIDRVVAIGSRLSETSGGTVIRQVGDRFTF